MKKIYFPLLVFIGISIHVNAQEKSFKEVKGDKYAFRYSFDKAIESYCEAKELTPSGQRHLAEAYHKMNQNQEAEAAYGKLINTNMGVIPEDYYNYAMMLKSNGKYGESNIWMDKFKEVQPIDLRVKSYSDNRADLDKMLQDNGKYQIEHLNLNTDAEDFGTNFYLNKIVFASSRAHPKWIKRKTNLNGKPFLDIYVSEMNGKDLNKPEIFNKKMNGKFHDGPASFNGDGTFMAFTRNNYRDKSKDKVVNLEIFFSTYSNGKWSKAESFAHNSPDYSCGHPSLSSNGKTMYFSCDMPGGFGGSDIYMVTKDEAGVWSKAKNMGEKINTEGNEMFPYYEETNQQLFIASDGHFGLGGLDVFICQMNGSEALSVENAGAPLNTRFDDFATIIDGKTNNGYFSSNRAGGSGDDDIYSVSILKKIDTKKKIEGLTLDINGNVIPLSLVTLYDDQGNVLEVVTTKEDGFFSFIAVSDKNYKLFGNKVEYLEGNTDVNTSGEEKVIKADIILLQEEKKPIEEAIVEKLIEVASDLAKVVNFAPIYFDYDKFNIRPDAAVELNKIVKIMNKYPKMEVELRAYTDCRGVMVYNDFLSNERAQSSAEYIKSRITNPSRISGRGYGETVLVTDCACEGDVVSTCSKEEHQKNRRTEFIVMKK